MRIYARKALGLLTAGGLLLGLAGCGTQEPAEPDYSALIEDALDVELADCLDAATLSGLLGYEWELVGVFEDGTQMIFTAATGEQVTVNAINETRQGFDALLTAMTDLEAVEALGEVAWWNGHELMTYTNGYALSVTVMLTDEGAALPQARAVTEHILKALAA